VLSHETICQFAIVLALSAIVLADNALLINGRVTFRIHLFKNGLASTTQKIPTQFNYQSVVRARTQVTEGTVDFSATDGPMNGEQLKAFKTSTTV
jgi:hypothetical protein